ncbi:MAG TPA: hypothetical protein VFU74_15120 [Actinocrinis sp.]|nr:hypothetical protein [Actinocrinis sp.]
MRNAFDLRAGLEQVRDGAGAWTFIRGFFEHWSRPLSDGDGCEEAEIRRAEQRLGIALPRVLRDGYRLCGRRGDLRRQMRLLLPHELRLDADAAVLVYREEDEHVVEIGTRLSGRGDPPALWRQPDPATRWEPYLPSLSWAWVEMVLSGSMGEEALTDILWWDAAGVAEVERRFDGLAVPGYLYAPELGRRTGTRWFAGHDVILRDDGWYACVRCRTEAALTRLHETLAGEWVAH